MAQDDQRQTEITKTAWAESGKVHGYRKLHDDLIDQGESICPNRVARLAQLVRIKAQIGYTRRPGTDGGKPSVVVDNAIGRKFDLEAPAKVWVTDIRTLEGFVVPDLGLALFPLLAGAQPGAGQPDGAVRREPAL